MPDDLKDIKRRLRLLEERGRNNPFEDPAIQLALEGGHTVSARTRSLALPMRSFGASTGAASQGKSGTYQIAWYFDDAALEDLVGFVTVPQDYVGGSTVRLFYSMGVDAGAVRWGAGLLGLIEGEDADAADASTWDNDTVPGTVDDVGTVDRDTGAALEAGDLLRVRIGRNGADGGDTAVGNARLLGAEFRYTAFF